MGIHVDRFNEFVLFFCKQKTAYELRISDWSADVCSSDLAALLANADAALFRAKDKSRGSVNFFDAETDQQIRDRRALHQDLSTDWKRVAEGKSVSVSADTGCRRLNNTKR